MPSGVKPIAAGAVRVASMRCVVSIVGPTASGKTEFGVTLVRALGERGERAQIVNADAYQMYRGMDVGTAKASAAQRAAVTHHLIDVIGPDETMTVARYQTLARACIRSLRSQGIRPVLVGGSGLYARAAIDDMRFPGTDPALRSRLRRRAKEEGTRALFAELARRDPVAAARMDARNVRRTIRALEVIELTGRPYSASLPHYRYVLPAVQIGLDMPRAELDRRIDARTAQMRRAGFVDEVRRLRPHLGPTASRALGYRQIIDALDGRIGEDEAFALIAQRTKRLARKQMGWFGRDPRIHWVAALAPDALSRALAVVAAADAGADRQDAGDARSRHHLGDVARQSDSKARASGVATR